MRKACRCSLEKIGIDNLGDLDIDGKIIVKYVL
jgi:hypothetical protein